MSEFKIGKTLVGNNHPAYFIAEIGSNHEGSLEKAKHLCTLAKQAGADCAKFQHYRADTLASSVGFAALGGNLAHYTDNPHTVFKRYEVPWSWTPELKAHCDSIGIEFMSTPYDLEAVDHLDPYVNAYKIGSGDITYRELIERIGSKGKPVILSTGASTWQEVSRAVSSWLSPSMGYEGAAIPPVAVLHCNTNYTNDLENAGSLNLSWLAWESDYVMGLSDHTTSPWVIAAAVGMGANIIERHFTDNVHGEAPDSPFAMDSYMFSNMVQMVRRLELAMGDGIKKVEENEKETVVLQRRAIRAAKLLPAGSVIDSQSLAFLRPCPVGALAPYEQDKVLGKTLLRDVQPGELINVEVV